MTAFKLLKATHQLCLTHKTPEYRQRNYSRYISQEKLIWGVKWGCIENLTLSPKNNIDYYAKHRVTFNDNIFFLMPIADVFLKILTLYIICAS